MRCSFPPLCVAGLAVLALATTASAQVPLASCKHSSPVTSVSFAPDGKTFATGCADNKIRVWDGATFKEQKQLTGLNSRVTSVLYGQDGKIVVAGSENGLVNVWDLATSQQRMAMNTGNRTTMALAVSADGRQLASGGNDRRIFIRDITNGAFLRVFHGHTNSISGCSISPDGSRLATASSDKTLRIWDMTNGRELLKADSKNEGFQAISFAPDGKRLATGAKDLIQVWDASNAKEQVKMEGPKGMVNCVAFSKDGKMLASACADGSIELWDTGTGKPLKHLGKHRGAANSVAFAPGGKFLASAGEDNTLMIWDVSPRIFLPARVVDLTAEDLNKYWTNLGGNDFAQAGEAIGTLAAAPKQVVPFLSERLKAARPDEDEARIKKLIVQLDDDQFAIREKAAMALERLGPASSPHLKEALKGDLSLEARRRAERILDKIKSPDLTPEQQRLQRAVTVLEITGTPEARKLLEELAKGSSGTWLALEAKSSLERFERNDKKDEKK
jgi:tricorn protease-like protein